MSFFPEEDKYMGNTDYFKPGKLTEGDEVKIRILSSPIVGWVNWQESGKPVRFYPDKKPRVPPNPLKPVKEFSAMLVWNYDLQMLQIWEFGQKNLKKSLASLAANKGSPLLYDIFVSKHGDGVDCRYILRPAAASKLDKVISEVYQDTPINLHALYVGKDPFVDLTAGKEVSDDASVA